MAWACGGSISFFMLGAAFRYGVKFDTGMVALLSSSELVLLATDVPAVQMFGSGSPTGWLAALARWELNWAAPGGRNSKLRDLIPASIWAGVSFLLNM